MDLSHRTFSIELCLGRGGFGEVYRAQMASPTGLASKVALKVLRRDLAPAGQAVQRLRDEGALLARLNHPVILRVHDLVVLDGRVSLVTEYVDGDDLERCLRDRDPMGVRALAEVVGLVASALDAAYNAPVTSHGGALKLVHRDIKPSNIRIGRHGEVKLLDFGIARSDEVTREARTMADMMVGSPPYMAPERFLNADLRPASDVFALGAIGLEGLLGARLFQAPVPMLASFAIDRLRYQDHLDERFARLPAHVPQAWLDLCRRMLAYDPDARPTAAEVSHECEALIDELPGDTLARWCRERHWLPAQREVGELDGRVLSEGTLARTWPDTEAPLVRGGPSPAPSRGGPGDLRTEGRSGPEPVPSGPSPSGPDAVGTTTDRALLPSLPSRSSSPTSQPPVRRRGWFVWLGGASLASASVGAVGLIGAAAVAGVVALAVWADPTAETPVVAPIEAPRPAPPPVPPEPEQSGPESPGPELPGPTPEPPRSTPDPTPAPSPREIVVEEPAPAPVPPPPQPARAGRDGRVVFDGDADVPTQLFGASGPVRAPGAVPAGTYTVRADFGGGTVWEREVVVEPDATLGITCRRRGQRCVLH